jgi:hypothetical protein
MIGRFFTARHSLIREQIKYLIPVDEMDALGVQAYKMSAVLAIVASFAGFNAEQVRIRAIDAFSQRNTDFGHRNAAGTADCNKILAGLVMLAFLQILVFGYESKYPTTHKYVRMGVVISLDLFKAFIYPMDTVSAVKHSRNQDVLAEIAFYRNSVAAGWLTPTSSANSFFPCRAEKSESFLA